MAQLGIAVERSRLERLWGEAVALEREGWLAVVSDEAARAGVRPGQAVTGARAICPKLTVLPYDLEAYEEAARPVWDLFAIESSVVEPVSPELCFVDLSGPGSAEAGERACCLAEQLTARLRIPVIAALARTRFLAHLAADFPFSVFRLQFAIAPHQEREFLAKAPVEAIPALDSRQKQRLAKMGVRTLGDVARLPSRDLRRRFGDLGILLERMARGDDGQRVRALWPPRFVEKVLAFDDEIGDLAALEEALRRLAERVAGELGRDYIRSVRLRLRLESGEELEQREKLASPVNAAGPLLRAALRLLGRMKVERAVVEAALCAADLGAGSGIQLALLDESRHASGLPHERSRALEAALARLAKRYGVGAVLKGERLRLPRRISLWTYPLCHRANEAVEVAVDSRGRPLTFRRGGQPARRIRRIHDRWRETEWFWDGLHETTVYRVESEDSGLSELHLHGRAWRIRSVSD